MDQIAVRNETAYEFLLRKGISKVRQPQRRYNLTIAELVEFLNEFAEGIVNEYESSGFMEDQSNFHYRANNDYAV